MLSCVDFIGLLFKFVYFCKQGYSYSRSAHRVTRLHRSVARNYVEMTADILIKFQHVWSFITLGHPGVEETFFSVGNVHTYRPSGEFVFNWPGHKIEGITYRVCRFDYRCATHPLTLPSSAYDEAVQATPNHYLRELGTKFKLEKLSANPKHHEAECHKDLCGSFIYMHLRYPKLFCTGNQDYVLHLSFDEGNSFTSVRVRQAADGTQKFRTWHCIHSPQEPSVLPDEFDGFVQPGDWEINTTVTTKLAAALSKAWKQSRK